MHFCIHLQSTFGFVCHRTVSLKGIYDVIRPKIWHFSDLPMRDRSSVPLWSERLPRYPNQIRGTHCSRLFTQQSGLDVNKAIWDHRQSSVCPSLLVILRSVAALCFGDPCHLLILRICSISQESRLQFVNCRFLKFPAAIPQIPAVCCSLEPCAVPADS